MFLSTYVPFQYLKFLNDMVNFLKSLKKYHRPKGTFILFESKEFPVALFSFETVLQSFKVLAWYLRTNGGNKGVVKDWGRRPRTPTPASICVAPILFIYIFADLVKITIILNSIQFILALLY